MEQVSSGGSLVFDTQMWMSLKLKVSIPGLKAIFFCEQKFLLRAVGKSLVSMLDQ